MVDVTTRLSNTSVNGVTLDPTLGASVFLRGDGTYATPAGGGGGAGGGSGQILDMGRRTTGGEVFEGGRRV